MISHALGHIMYGLCYWYLWNVHHLPKCIICHKAIVMITGRTHCFRNYMPRRKPWPISSFALIYLTDICTMAKLKKPDKKKKIQQRYPPGPSFLFSRVLFLFLFPIRYKRNTGNVSSNQLCISHKCSLKPPLLHPFPLVKRIFSKTFPNDWILPNWWLIIIPYTISKTSFHWSRKISPLIQFHNYSLQHLHFHKHRKKGTFNSFADLTVEHITKMPQ